MQVQWMSVAVEPFVSQKDWIVLTKDEDIGRNILEVQAISRAKGRVFILVSCAE